MTREVLLDLEHRGSSHVVVLLPSKNSSTGPLRCSLHFKGFENEVSPLIKFVSSDVK